MFVVVDDLYDILILALTPGDQIQPDFAWLSVDGAYNVPIELDGKNIGNIPIKNFHIEKGNHQVEHASECFYKAGERFTWKKLKDNYGDALKLIVVAPKRNDGSCNVKGWNDVDETICDEDQKIAKSWGVKDFPQAFLYSWHNNDPLVQHGHVKDVENAIIKYYKNIPRVAIYADNNSQELVPKVEEELNKHSKIELVSNESEREQILALKKESHSLKYNDNLKCELGKEISANSILNITKTGNSLTLKLSSVEKSCTMAVTTKELSGNINTKIAAAVDDLLSQMFGNMHLLK